MKDTIGRLLDRMQSYSVNDSQDFTRRTTILQSASANKQGNHYLHPGQRERENCGNSGTTGGRRVDGAGRAL